MEDSLKDMEVFFDEEEDTQKDLYLTFITEGELYAIEIGCVTEIIGVPAITQIPDMEDYVKGIINLRGQFVPMMDIRVRLHKPSISYTDRTCTIVVDYGEYTVGMIIDAVSDVVKISEDKIMQPPSLKDAYQHRFIKGIGKAEITAVAGDENEDEEAGEEAGPEYDVVFILDLEELFETERRGEEDDNRN